MMASQVESRRYDSSNRERQAGETRRRIVVAAARLFVRNGYSATSISAIAEEAGVAGQHPSGSRGVDREGR